MMFTDVILDYYRNPQNKGVIEGADIHARDTNPLCGDVLEITATVEDGAFKELKFSGNGCAISQAAASMLCEHLAGKPVEDAKRLTKDDILKLLSIPISPVRLKCALLGLKVLKMGAYEHLGMQLSRDEAETL
ncbi:iron-sulfur cluster assembly scaffold protein [Candidatus Woesearchaeota archaeon]|nr:iron-sulfur cluster assembly scaffold protein [Candidatus Woesearchaeota archaeon]